MARNIRNEIMERHAQRDIAKRMRRREVLIKQLAKCRTRRDLRRASYKAARLAAFMFGGTRGDWRKFQDQFYSLKLAGDMEAREAMLIYREIKELSV